MIPKRVQIALAALVVTGGPIAAKAHVPSKCGQLYIKAGKESARMTRKGKQVSDLSLDGLDVVEHARRRRVIDEYLKLADQVAQLLGGQTAFFDALIKAINCTAGPQGR